MSSLAACFKIHGTSKDNQDTIRQMVQDHKDNGSTSPALDALNDMIKMSEASRVKVVERIEAAGGKATEGGQDAAASTATSENINSDMDQDLENTIVADSFPQVDGQDVKALPEEWPARTVVFAEFFSNVYESQSGWEYKSITQARNAVAEKFSLEQTGPFKKAVDEAIEYAVVQISRSIYTDGLQLQGNPRVTFDHLVRLYEQQPRLATRTSESVRNQAYSTPAPIAMLANVLALMDQRRGDVVYEPTAGTGMLLMGADPDSVIVNEMDDTRVAILKEQFSAVQQGDALQVTLAGKPDVVITNPPFGKVKHESGTPKTFNVDGFKTQEIDQAITLDALDKMVDNGRAVLIIGGLDKQIPEEERAKRYGAGGKKRYFEELYTKYNVVDHFTISGDLYNKQGAGWPIDVIVIRGKGESDKATPEFVAPPIYKTFEELGERLEKITFGQENHFGMDATRREQKAATPVRGPRTIATGAPFANNITTDGTATEQGLQSGQEGDGTRTGSTERPDEQVRQDWASAIRGTGEGAQSLAENPEDNELGLGADGVYSGQDRREGTEGDTGSQGSAGVNDDVRLAGSTGSRSGRKVVASEGQVHYRPESKGGEIGTLTPVNMSKPLQDALQRLSEKHGSVDNFVYKSLKYKSLKELHDAFSAEQIDAVALALDNIQKGSGFILGDQTGIGKGRVVAAMIRYAYNEGKVPVFMTEKQALYSDMYRDMIDIGFAPSIADSIMQTNSGSVFLNEDDDVKLVSPSKWNGVLDTVDGMPTVGRGKNAVEKSIVFTTYDQLNIQYKKGTDVPAPRRRFLQQLMNSGKVVLIMDEAHNAGGSGDLENQRPNPTTGIVPLPRALLLRQLIPLADGVVYSSATYAKNPEVMDLYSSTDLRLGVGGDIGQLAGAITSGGIPFQQITAGMLTRSGQYIRRERSFEGVTYDPHVMEVDIKAAEDVSSAMSMIRVFEETFIVPAMEADGEASGSNAVGSIGEQSQTFTSLMHNIIDQMLLALKVKPSVELAIETLKNGAANNEQVVLTVSNTMGSFIERYAEDNNLQEGDAFKASFNDLIQRYLYNTRTYITGEKDEKGNNIHFWLEDEELGADGVVAYNEVTRMISKMDLSELPVSPVDYMLNELNKAGFPGLEITGRNLTVDYSSGEPVLSKRDPYDRTVDGRNKTIRNYNDGKSRVIILNRSGSTGISLHASERNPINGQGKRHMIIVQAEKDINVHMQMLGRVHRTGQVIEPAYKQAVANIPAEMKPAALLLARMSSLSANTTADADSLFTDKGAVNFLNKYGDAVAAEAMNANPTLNRILGSPFSKNEDGSSNITDLIKKVTGRLPLLPIKQQEQVYNELIVAYKDLIAELDSMGRNDLEAKTFDLDAKTVETMEISPKSGESPFQDAAIAEKIDMKRIGKPFTGDELKQAVKENEGQGEAEATKALEEFETYRNETLAAAQVKVDEASTDSTRNAAEAALVEIRTRLDSDLSTFTTLNEDLAVGKSVQVDLKMSEGEPALPGVVIGKVRRGDPRNPLALSTWRVKIAVADGIRVLNLPLSKINDRPGAEAKKVDIETWWADLGQAAKTFDTASTSSRETRWMITGNIFTGYSVFQKSNGQIVNFTRDSGETEQGVLMPRTFDPTKALESAPVVFETTDQIDRWFSAVNPAVLKLRQPGDLRIIKNSDRYTVSVHKSVAKGGRFFRDDRALLKITGSFTSSSSRMTTEPLSLDKIHQIIELFRSRGNTWFVDMGITEARGIVQATDEPKQSRTSTKGASVITGEDGRAYILEDLAREIYKAGQTIGEFILKLKKILGKAFEQIRSQVKALYNKVNAHLDTITSGAQAGNVRIADEPDEEPDKTGKKEIKRTVANDTPTSPLSTESLAEIAGKMGTLTIIKNKKIDSTFLDRIFSTPEYYFKKFAAAGRVLQAALLRRDIRHEKEQLILAGFVTYIQDLRKNHKEAYAEANGYLVNTDQTTDGFRIKTLDSGKYQVLRPESALTEAEVQEIEDSIDRTQSTDKQAYDRWKAVEEKMVVGEFVEEAEGIEAMITAESALLRDRGYSKEAIEAVKQARELTNRGFDIMAADMRRIIQEAKEAGLPDPFIGDGKIDESGRYGVYAAGKSKPIALFATEKEANEMLDNAARMISYVVISKKKGPRTFENELKAKRWAAAHSGTVHGRKTFQNLSVKKRSNADMRPLTVKAALAQMGDLRGIFFPRIRETGEYILIATKDGENPIRKHFDIPAVGDDRPTLQAFLSKTTPIGQEIKALRLRGYNVTTKKDDSPSEDVFEATNLLTSMDALLQSSMEVVNKNEDMSVKAGQHINKMLTMQIADIFKSRGYLSSRLKRLAGDVVWEGYEEDMGKALTQYGKSVAAGTAKRDTARAMVLAFTGRDYTWAQYKTDVEKPEWEDYIKIVEERRIDERTQKNLFRDVRSFMIDILRNDEQADRIIGTLKGLAVLKHLGFRVSSAAVNVTNMAQGVPATISGHTGESLTQAIGRVISAATAYRKYRKSISKYKQYIPGSEDISDDDRKIFEYISAKGWDEAKFNQEAASELRGKFGEGVNKFMTAGMYMFGAAEKVNRATTLFAAYKAVKAKETTADESVIWEKAKEISDRAHGIYGKETLPDWARGQGAGARVARLFYLFKKFSHNYMLNMIDLGFNRKEYKAAAYMLLSPALLAGSSASLAGPALFALAGAFGIGGDDPEEEWYKWAEDTFGAGDYARHGVFGGLAGINIKGSLQMNNPMPTSLTELVGAAGGVVADTGKGINHLFHGELAKGAEMILPTAFGSWSKSFREGREGITTSNYGSVFYGNEPLKADAMDQIIRFLSFNPSRISGIREKQWHEKQVTARYQEDMADIYSDIKRLHIQGKAITPEIYKAIYAYNERVAGSGRPDLSPITPKGIISMLKRNNKAGKLERMRDTDDE